MSERIAEPKKHTTNSQEKIDKNDADNLMSNIGLWNAFFLNSTSFRAQFSTSQTLISKNGNSKVSLNTTYTLIPLFFRRPSFLSSPKIQLDR